MVVALTVAVYRPDTLRPEFEQVSALAGRSWRRQRARGVSARRSCGCRARSSITRRRWAARMLPERDKQALRKREQRAIERCRSLSGRRRKSGLHRWRGARTAIRRDREESMASAAAGAERRRRRAPRSITGVGTRGKTTRCDDFLELTLLAGLQGQRCRWVLHLRRHGCSLRVRSFRWATSCDICGSASGLGTGRRCEQTCSRTAR